MSGLMDFGILDPNVTLKAYSAYDDAGKERMANQLQKLAYDQAIQQADDDKAMRGYYQQAGGDMNKLIQLAGAGGRYRQAMDLQKQMLEQQAKQAGVAKDYAETAAKTYQLGRDQGNDAKLFLRAVQTVPSEFRQMAWDNALAKYKELYPMANLGDVPEQYDESYVTGLLGQVVGQKDPSKLLPDNKTVDLKDRSVTTSYDPLTGKPISVVNTQQFGQSPDNAATVAATMRGQNMVDTRAREQLQQGKIPPGYRVNKDGTLSAIPGGPADPQVKTEQAAAKVLAIISEARAILQSEDPTSSYLGAGVNHLSRGVGIGTASMEADAKLKALEPAIMMALPRMEGPQSDKDVALYRQAAGQIGDTTQPINVRLAALDQIESLHQKYSKNGANPVHNPAHPKKINSDAEYNELPAGSVFIGPDGKTRRKP